MQRLYSMSSTLLWALFSFFTSTDTSPFNGADGDNGIVTLPVVELCSNLNFVKGDLVFKVNSSRSEWVDRLVVHRHATCCLPLCINQIRFFVLIRYARYIDGYFFNLFLSGIVRSRIRLHEKRLLTNHPIFFSRFWFGIRDFRFGRIQSSQHLSCLGFVAKFLPRIGRGHFFGFFNSRLLTQKNRHFQRSTEQKPLFSFKKWKKVKKDCLNNI